MVSKTRYYPFGAIEYQTAPSPTDRLFTGQRQLATNEIYDYGARIYNAYTGRFLQADTIVPEPGNPQSLNRYSYVLNNPLRYTDPTGHRWEDGWTPNTNGSDEGIGDYDPYTAAASIVGTDDPVIAAGGDPDAPCYFGHASDRCWDASDQWWDDTIAAAEFFKSIGWNVDDIPWSPDQRLQLSTWFGYAEWFRSSVDDWETELLGGGFFLAMASLAEDRAAGNAFAARSAHYLRAWGVGEEQMRIASPTGTAQYRVTDGTVRAATGDLIAIAEFKLRTNGTINLTAQLRDMLQGEYRLIFGFSSQATLSHPLQRALANAAWIRLP